MSTPYAISRSIGSSTYNSYVNAPIWAPLSTNQYPNDMPFHSNGTLIGTRPTPPQFYPSQEPPSAQNTTNARRQYSRATAYSIPILGLENVDGHILKPYAFYNISTGRRYPISSNVNYIAPQASSMRLNELKSIAIGKSAYKIGLPIKDPISTKNYGPSSTRSSLRRARSGGCVAPKKKGAIENTSLKNGVICAWGAIPRQTY